MVFLHYYLTLCTVVKPYLHSKVVKIAIQIGRICKVSMPYRLTRPYVHTVFLPSTSLQLRLPSLQNFADTAFLVNNLAIYVHEI